MNQSMNEQATRDQQAIQAAIFENFQKKIEQEIITFEEEDGQVILIHKRLDSLQKETDPIKMVFTTSYLVKLRIERRHRQDELELQMIALKDELNRLKKEDTQIYAVLEEKVKQAEEAAERPVNQPPKPPTI